MLIDCSGDGDLFASAGEPFDKDPCVPWLWFRMGGVELPDDAITAAEGRFFPSLGGRFFHTIGDGRTLMPWGASDAVGRRIDLTDPEELTWAEIECRRLVMKEVDRLRTEVPGFKNAYVNDIAWQLGIYELRRLRGRHLLVRDERISVRRHDRLHRELDALRRGLSYPVSRPFAGAHEELDRSRTLISADRVVHKSTKEIPPCMATGQAAGIAAALALEKGAHAAGIDVAALQRRLRDQGAILT